MPWAGGVRRESQEGFQKYLAGFEKEDGKGRAFLTRDQASQTWRGA